MVGVPDGGVPDGGLPGGDPVTTERLVLRRWTMADLDDLERVFSKPDVWWYPFRRGWTRDETQGFLERRLAEWDAQGWSLWAVVHRADRRLIGYLGLARPTFLPEVMPAVEIGWRLDPDYWNQGLATEGARAALALGFDVLGLDEIVSIYEPDNVASGRVMEHLGMALDRETTHPGLGVPLRVCTLTADRWRELRRPWPAS
jgi:RimJ/RimL family protein N-acetyltransferase